MDAYFHTDGVVNMFITFLSGLHPQRHHETLGKRVGLGGVSGDFPSPAGVLGNPQKLAASSRRKSRRKWRLYPVGVKRIGTVYNMWI